MLTIGSQIMDQMPKNDFQHRRNEDEQREHGNLWLDQEAPSADGDDRRFERDGDDAQTFCCLTRPAETLMNRLRESQCGIVPR